MAIAMDMAMAIVHHHVRVCVYVRFAVWNFLEAKNAPEVNQHTWPV
jgi:hypothetical protein